MTRDSSSVVFLLIAAFESINASLCNENTPFRCICETSVFSKGEVLCTDLYPHSSSITAVKSEFYGCPTNDSLAMDIFRQRVSMWIAEECVQALHCGKLSIAPDQIIFLRAHCSGDAKWELYFVAQKSNSSTTLTNNSDLVMDPEILVTILNSRGPLLSADMQTTQTVFDRAETEILNSTVSGRSSGGSKPFYKQAGFIVGCSIAGYVIFVWSLAGVKCFLDSRKRKKGGNSRASREERRESEVILPAITLNNSNSKAANGGEDLKAMTQSDSLYDNFPPMINVPEHRHSITV